MTIALSIFIGVLLYIIFDSWLEARHDVTIIHITDVVNSSTRDRWHRLSWIDRAFEYVILNVLFLFIVQDWFITLLALWIYGVWYWFWFDMFIGYRLVGSIFYIGTTGFDKKMRKLFKTGAHYAIFKFILFLSSSTLYILYLRYWEFGVINLRIP